MADTFTIRLFTADGEMVKERQFRCDTDPGIIAVQRGLRAMLKEAPRVNAVGFGLRDDLEDLVVLQGDLKHLTALFPTTGVEEESERGGRTTRSG